MLRFALAAALVACLAGCHTKPAQRATAIEPKLPRFAASVGQLDQADAFLKFIDSHDRQTVALDLAIPSDEFEGGEESQFSFFVVYDDCDNLPEGQKPNQSFCTGVEYNIPHTAGAPHALVEDAGVWRLRGRFRIEHAPGQQQGLMSVNLVPVPAGSEPL